MTRIVFDPVTRLEGHGRVEIVLDDAGDVADAFFIVPELRGFESLCVGRPVEEMPRITNQICGLCPEAHHLASVKALDDLFGVTPPPAVAKVRELFYSTFFVLDHATHFFVLGGPDFLLDESTPAGERTFFGVARALGEGLAREVIATRQRCGKVIEMLGGRRIHPVAGLPGGWSQPVTEAMRREIALAAEANVAFALQSLDLFRRQVLTRSWFRDAMVSDVYAHRTYSMGTVDAANRPNFYDGTIRVVDPDGAERLRYHPRDYREHLAEHVEPWTYVKFPYLRGVGWKGFVDGPESGVYCSTPLARLNAADGMATPRAAECCEELYDWYESPVRGARRRPIHNRLATHWARLVELLYAAERMAELAADRGIVDAALRPKLQPRAGIGVGSVEAPRGTLTHQYACDERGIVTHVNLVVGTTNNHAALALSVRKVAASLLRRGTKVSDALLHRIEVVIRSYDPCLSCATHALPGRMPLEVTVRDAGGQVVQRVVRGG